MKKLLAIVTVAAFTACGGSNDSSDVVDESTDRNIGSNAATANDSVQGADSVMQTGDTTALNTAKGDSTSQSGSHGEGSGSRVGGGKTGEPQGEKSE